jgi:hypothetical protein
VSLSDAIHRRDALPGLRRFISDAWLKREGAKERGRWHPFYDWLEAPKGHADADTILRAIETAVTSDISGAVSRARRLTAGRSDFWSAVGELYMAAQLAGCGLAVELSSPDVRVRHAAGIVDLELNAVHATHDLTELQELIAGRLTVPGTVVVWCSDWRIKIGTALALEIAERVVSAARLLRSLPLAKHDVLGSDERASEVHVSDLVDEAHLRVFVAPGDPGCVVTRIGPRTRLVDLWPSIKQRVAQKLDQLASSPCGIVAIEAGFSHPSAVTWAKRAALGYDVPVLQTDENIAGLLVYWLDLRHYRPWRSYFVRNVVGACAESGPVTAVLDCLGTIRMPFPGC